MADVRVPGAGRFLPSKIDAGRPFVALAVKDYKPFVRDDAQRRFESYDAGSAAGYRVSVRQHGVSVVQSRRKTTGRRPDFGELQMRKALLPAALSNQDKVEAAFGKALDRVADHFDHN